MRTFFKDIFSYQLETNLKLANLLIAHQDHISERTIPLFSHNVNAHQIWNARILNYQEIEVNDLHTLEHCKILDRSNYDTSIEILSTYDLNTMIHFQNSSGESFEKSLKHILFHVSNHFTHHRGQIVSDLRKKGIAPPVTDYIYYKR